MFYTLTTNPAVDFNISVNGIEPDIVNRTFDEVYTPNGKGLNVSFVLRHFGIDTKILGFFGGFTGEYIVRESQKKAVDVEPIWVQRTTRINVFLNDGIDEYKLVNKGPIVTKEEESRMLDHIRNLNDMDFLTINGSSPIGLDNQFYERVLEICESKGTHVILDTSSQHAKEMMKYKPYLIKPNDDELLEVFGLPATSEDTILHAIKVLHTQGAQNVLITLGENGSYFSNGSDVYFAGVTPINLVSSACAGDAFLAGFLSIYAFDESRIIAALKRASALGANVAESNGLGDFSKVQEYEKRIEVYKL